MDKLVDLFRNVMVAIIQTENLILFEQLVNDIINNKNEHEILELAVDLGTKFLSEFTVAPMSSLTTYRKEPMEGSNTNVTAKDLNLFAEKLRR